MKLKWPQILSSAWVRATHRVRYGEPYAAPPNATLAPMFEVVLVETRNTCTRTCNFCKFGQERQDEGLSTIDDALLEKIAAELGAIDYAGRLSPFGINEPLIEPRIFEILALFRRSCPKALLTIASNGDCLNGKVYDRLFAAGLDYIFVDAYDDAIFEKVSQLVERGNITINDMREPDWRFLENRGGSIKGDDRRAIQRQGRNCLRPSSMLVIRPPGEVVLCCSDMYGDVIMGDLRTDSIVDIWLNDKFQHYRNTLATEGRANLELCQGCSHRGDGAKRDWSTPDTETHQKQKGQKRDLSLEPSVGQFPAPPPTSDRREAELQGRTEK